MSFADLSSTWGQVCFQAYGVESGLPVLTAGKLRCLLMHNVVSAAAAVVCVHRTEARGVWEACWFLLSNCEGVGLIP